MNYSLSEKDIQSYFGNQIKIIPYDALQGIENLDNYMENIIALVILYRYEQTYGHWTCLIKRCNNTFEFFDPVGTKPDILLLDIPMRIRNALGQDYALLAPLLLDSSRSVEYNNEKLQKENDNIKTCGKWVVIRIMMRDLPLKTFQNMFMGPQSDKMIHNLYEDAKKNKNK